MTGHGSQWKNSRRGLRTKKGQSIAYNENMQIELQCCNLSTNEMADCDNMNAMLVPRCRGTVHILK
jgi:hypothetical protein